MHFAFGVWVEIKARLIKITDSLIVTIALEMVIQREQMYLESDVVNAGVYLEVGGIDHLVY